MKTIVILFTATLLMFINHDSEAQIDKFVKQKANKALNKASKKLDKKVDKKIDEEVDNLFDKDKDEEESIEKKSTETETENEQSKEVKKSSSNYDQQKTQAFFNMMGMGAEVTTADSYDFTSSVLMEMQSYDKNGEAENKSFYKSLVNPENNNYAIKYADEVEEMKKETGMMVFDFVNKAMIILSNENGQKTGIVTPIDSSAERQMEEEIEEYEREDPDKVSGLKKTGNTKTILGYTCEEYKYTTETGEVSYWFTDDVDVYDSKMFGKMDAVSMYFTGQLPYGTMLEMESRDFNTKERFVLQVKEINTKATETIDMDGYQLISIGSKQKDKEEQLEQE